MDRLGDQFLAGAVLAFNEHGLVGRDDLVEQRQDAAHGLTLADDRLVAMFGRPAAETRLERALHLLEPAALLFVLVLQLRVGRFQPQQRVVALALDLRALDRAGREVGEALQRLEVLLAEHAARDAVVDVDDADRGAALAKRHAQHRARRDLVNRLELREPVVGSRVDRDQRVAAHRHALGDRARERLLGAHDGLALEVAGDGDGHPLRRLEDQEAALGLGQLDDVVHDQVEDAVEIELGVERRCDALETLELIGLPGQRCLVEPVALPGPGRLLALQLGGQALQVDVRAADLETVAGLHGAAVDALAVQIRSVGRSLVEDQQLVPRPL